jgi:hypothetical protein
MGFENLKMPLRPTLSRTVARAAGAFVAAGLVGVTLSAQSLGELAKMEEERRKAIKSSGKVYTNESIRPEPGSQPPPAPSAGAAQPAPAVTVASPSPSGVQPPVAGAATPSTAAAPGAGSEKKDEAYWKGRIQAAREALRRDEVFADALQSRINALSTDFVNRDDPAQRAVVATDRQKALAELDRVRQDIQQHTKSIAAIQEEARRAGVPPGWLR